MDSLEFDAAGGAGGPDTNLNGLIGKQVGRYLVGQPLGSGGAATVYRAYDQVQGITVALKLLLPGADEKAYDRFRREATLAGALRHPHIVRILQIGIAPKGEVAYIAMELVEGESLSDLLTMRGRLRPEETANLLEPVARALAYAHRQGVIHRDVKPGNILLRTASPGAANSVQLEALEYPVVPLLSDFGIARALDAPELTMAGRTVGTPAYMAPEQCAGSRQVDGRADIYSLGAVLYRCLTGRLPYSGTTTQILHAQVYEPLLIEESVLRTLPPLLVEVLQYSMAKRPEERYANADLMADALAQVAGRMPPQTSQGAPPGDGSTATLTLTALPTTPPSPSAPTATVLVAGLSEPGTPPAAPSSVPSSAPYTPSSASYTPQQTHQPQQPPYGSQGGQAAPPSNPFVRAYPAQPTGQWVAGQPPSGQTPAVTELISAQDVDEGGGFGGRLERLNWPGLAITAVIGLVAIFLVALFGIQGPGLLDRLTGGTTPTPGAVSQATGTPGLLPGVVLTDTVTATVTPSPLPSATPTALPSATATAVPTETPVPPTPVPLPTDTPLPPPTATPTFTPLPTMTALPTATPGPNPTLAACLSQIDPGFQTYLLGLDPAVQAVFGCPDGPAQVGLAESLPFEHGYIVGFDMTPEMLVVYTAGQQWERQFVPPDSGAPGDQPPGDQPPAGLYMPSGRFGLLWSQGERRNELGFATAPEPGEFPTVYQSFPGALMILNQSNGQVVVLPTASQR